MAVPNRIIIGRHYLSHFTHDDDRELSPTLTTNFKHRKEQHGSDPFKVLPVPVALAVKVSIFGSAK